MSAGLFNLVFPDNCHICDAPLEDVQRVPVCAICLAAPQPLVAEYTCVCCHTPFLTPHPLDEEGRCGLCRRGLSGFDAAYSFSSYEGTLRKLIQLFKYGRVSSLAKPLGGMLADALPRERVYDLIVPMPMHWRRRWSRGFNQAELLARVISGRLNVPVSGAVHRRKATAPQAGLTGAQRRANMSGAFGIRRPEAVRGKRILLVDDVFTTGATAGACARRLKRAGAAKVEVLTVARAGKLVAGAVSGTVWNTVGTPSLGRVLDAQSG
jgi:ComF family protein